MARIINTAEDDLSKLGPMQKLWCYNGLDTAITLEVLEKCLPQLVTTVKENGVEVVHDLRPIYNFALGLQAPVLEMMLRGINIDHHAKERVIVELENKRVKLDYLLQTLAEAAWGQGLNHNSPKQLQDFFYGFMQIPPVKLPFKGVWRVTTNREALEKIKVYFYAGPFVEIILQLRDCTKKLGVLRKGLSEDGRFRFSMNIGGTETGRFSSSESAFGEGDNLQNQTEMLRHIFISDFHKTPPMKMGYADLQQAESRAVAALSGDEAYWEACHAKEDLHTAICKMVWPELKWTGDPKKDKSEIAEAPYYRHFSYRDIEKRGQHGSNYKGQPYTMARHIKVPPDVMVKFQQRYFGRFAGIPKWHMWVARELQLKGYLWTPLGRRRHFFGRRDEDDTIRAAIAHCPQSHVGDLLNLALWRVWKHLVGPDFHILGQVHDAILFQYNEEKEMELIPRLLELMTIPVKVGQRILTIPADVAVGWNWGKYLDEFKAAKKKVPANPFGLKEWTGERDTRQRPKPSQTQLLDSIIY